MIKLILFLLFFALFLAFSPEKYWEYIFDYCEKLAIKMKNYSSLKNGQNLQKLLAQIETQLQIKGNIGSYHFPQYKFYTSLCSIVFDYCRRFGASVRGVCLELREALAKDLHFEKKVKKELWGGFAQFFLVAFVTWVFVFLSLSLLELKINKPIFIWMLVLQFSGFSIYFFTFFILRKKKFNHFTQIYSSFYALLILSEVGLSIRQTLQESSIQETFAIKSKFFNFLILRVRDLIERWRTVGTPLKNELKELIDLAKNLEIETYESFLKTLSVFKFLILSFFFLPSYFLYLFSFFHTFLIE